MNWENGKVKKQRSIVIIFMIALFTLAISVSALCERAAWDCPECGRTGNIGDYCGKCGHRAPPPDNDKSSEEDEDGSTSVGGIITFGAYPQTSEGKDNTPIDWIVLDVQDGKALLLSKYGLAAQAYNTEYKDITWEECTLRRWLNNDFFKSAFSDKEQSAIITTDVDNSANQGFGGWSTTGGKNTMDKIFLLSYAEANKYLDVTASNYNNMKSRVSPTAYAKTQNAYTSTDLKTDDDEAAGWWWLRSPARDQWLAAIVYSGGTLDHYGVDCITGVVRPALWVDLESGIY